MNGTLILCSRTIFVFEAYYINVWVEFDFANSERKTKPIHIPIAKKIHRLERAQYEILDHVTSHNSFSDAIK